MIFGWSWYIPFQQPGGTFEYLSRQLKSPSLLSKTLTKKSNDKSRNNATGSKNNIAEEKPKQTDGGDTLGECPKLGLWRD